MREIVIRYIHVKYESRWTSNCQIMDNWIIFNKVTFDLDMWPWPWNQGAKICCSLRYMFAPNIKFVCGLSEKLWQMLNLRHFINKMTIDLDMWPWHKKKRYQNVWLLKIHVFIKYEVYMCSQWKGMANVKVAEFYQ